jgi:V8-like Glu-specific endopeptidase
MAHFLDSLPFDWTDPAARELRNFLASSYFREPPVVQFAQAAGVQPATVAWGRPMLEVWHDLIQQARNQNRLRELLQQIEAGADAAVALRLQELRSAAPVVEAPAPPASAGVWKGFDDPDAQERQIFEKYSLLDIAFLRRGLELAPAVARLLVTLPTGKYHGTAFRIGDDLLLTNHHVLFDKDAGDAPATEVEVWFGYERTFSGSTLAHEVVMGRPETITGGKGRDWAVVRVASPMPEGTPTIELAGARPVRVEDRVYVIQHPSGGVKKIGMHHNVVRHVDDDVVQYWTDTEGGSSGSPVFDERWQLVALHHRWVETTVQGVKEFRNQGQRMAKVVEEMKAAGVL